MDLSASYHHLSQEEYDRCQQENLCMYCGGTGHMARDCPNKRRHPLAAAATTSTFESPPAHASEVAQLSEN